MFCRITDLHDKEVINACRVYFEKTGRRVTFEYSLVSGVNDSRHLLLQANALTFLPLVKSLHRWQYTIPVRILDVHEVVEVGLACR